MERRMDGFENDIKEMRDNISAIKDSLSGHLIQEERDRTRVIIALLILSVGVYFPVGDIYSWIIAFL